MAARRRGRDAGALRPLLEEAEAQVHRTVRELHIALGRLGDRPADAPREVSDALRALGKALTAAFEERARLDRLREHGGEARSDGRDIDYDAVRDEIGRRLARLRAARSGGDVPGGS